MIVYLIRHAEPKLKTGLSDGEKISIGLSDFGRFQAKATARAIKNIGVERIYSSSIERAKETAEIISFQTGLIIEYDDRLREFSTDLDLKDCNKQEKLKIEARNNPNKIMAEGESLNFAVMRLENFLKSLYDLGVEKVCVVTHRVIMEGYLTKEFSIRFGDRDWLRLASITSIEIKKGHKPKLVFLNKYFRDWALIKETLKRRITKKYE